MVNITMAMVQYHKKKTQKGLHAQNPFAHYIVPCGIWGR